MTLKKVQTGDPLKIPASTFNSFIDAARAHQQKQADQRGNPRNGEPMQTGWVYLRNDTDADLERFEVAGIDGPIITPDDNLPEFTRRATVIGKATELAKHRGRFAIALEPIAIGQIGKACVSGVVPAKVEIVEESDERADIAEASPALTSGPHGACEILWKEDGVGSKWALVKLGVGEPLFVTFEVSLSVAGGKAGDNGFEDCTYTYDIFDLGTGVKLNEDGPLAPESGRPALTQMTPAWQGVAYWTIVGGELKVALQSAFEHPTPRAVVDVITALGCTKVDGGTVFTWYTTRLLLPPGTSIGVGPASSIFCPCCCDPDGSGSGSTQ